MHMNVLASITHKGCSVRSVEEDISEDPVHVSATLVLCLQKTISTCP